MGVGQGIKKLRVEKGLSVANLAERSGLTRATIHNIEKYDRTPRSDVLKKIAEGLDVDMPLLLEDVTTKYKERLFDLGIPDLEWTLSRMPDLEESDREFILEYARDKAKQNRRKRRQAEKAEAAALDIGKKSKRKPKK